MPTLPYPTVTLILTLVFIIVFKGVSSLIIILLSSFIRLSVLYGCDGGDRDSLGLEATAGPGINNLDAYGPGAYSLPV